MMHLPDRDNTVTRGEEHERLSQRDREGSGRVRDTLYERSQIVSLLES